MKEFIKSAYETVLGSNFVDVTFFDRSLRSPKEVTRKNLLLAETFFGDIMATPSNPGAKAALLERKMLLDRSLLEIQRALESLSPAQGRYRKELERLEAYTSESIKLRSEEIGAIESGDKKDLSKIGAKSSQLLVKAKLYLEKFEERFAEEADFDAATASPKPEAKMEVCPPPIPSRDLPALPAAKIEMSAEKDFLRAKKLGGAISGGASALPEFLLTATRDGDSETAPIPAPPQAASGVADSRVGHLSSGPGAAAYQPPKFLGSTLDRMATKAENLAPPPAAARRSRFPLPKTVMAAELKSGMQTTAAPKHSAVVTRTGPAEPQRRVIGFDPPPPAATANTRLTPVAPVVPVVATTPAAAPPPMEIEEPVAAAHRNSLEEPLLGAPPPKETTSTSHNKVANKGNCCAIL